MARVESTAPPDGTGPGCWHAIPASQQHASMPTTSMEASWRQSWTALAAASLVSLLYPASLYVWPGCIATDRRHPRRIKRHFLSVTVLSAVLVPLLCRYRRWAENLPPSDDHLDPFTYKRYEDVWSWAYHCLLVPLAFLTTLFLGPIVAAGAGSGDGDGAGRSWLALSRDLLVGPVTEELIFRGILLTLLRPFWSAPAAVLLSSGLFALMHAHSTLAKRLAGQTVYPDEWAATGVQCAFTGLFGLYAASAYLATGHLITPVVLHMFCNLVGLPDFQLLLADARYLGLTVAGFAVWAYHLVFDIIRPFD